MRFSAYCSMLRISILSLILVTASIYTASSAGQPAHLTLQPPTAATSAGEQIDIFASDCVTPKAIFKLGDVVCAKASNFPERSLGSGFRRFAWISPNLLRAAEEEILSDGQTHLFQIPTSGKFAQPGSWHVSTINIESGRYSNARFIVRNHLIPSVDFSLSIIGPSFVLPGDRLLNTVWLTNPGPDDAFEIELIDEVPTNTTFVGLKQESGPPFDCKTPERGGTGKIVCTTKSMRMDETAKFLIYYEVLPGARNGDVCRSTAQVTSTTEELQKEDNTSTTQVVVTVPDPSRDD